MVRQPVNWDDYERELFQRTKQSAMTLPLTDQVPYLAESSAHWCRKYNELLNDYLEELKRINKQGKEVLKQIRELRSMVNEQTTKENQGPVQLPT